MTTPSQQQVIVGLVIQELPTIIAGIKELFRKHSPDLPLPTNEEVIAAFDAAYQASLAKDDAILDDLARNGGQP